VKNNAVLFIPAQRTTAAPEPIKVVREFLFVPLTISARTAAHLYAARSHGVHEISHIEFRADVFRGVQFAARTQGVTAFFDDLGGQGNIARNYQVSGLESFDDFVVRNSLAVPGGC
jgi:hypothetical protein